MAKTATPKENRVQVSTSVEPKLAQFIDDLHWSERRPKPDILREAIQFYAESKGYTPAVDAD